MNLWACSDTARPKQAFVSSRWLYSRSKSGPSRRHWTRLDFSPISLTPLPLILFRESSSRCRAACPRTSSLYLDLYPIEISTNLHDWRLLTTLVQTNADTNRVVYADRGAAPGRFYRTPATNLFAISPPPTGPYAVGTFDRVFTDASLSNRYGIETNNSFVVTFWYPGTREPGRLPERILDSELSSRFGAYAALIHNDVFKDLSLAADRMAYPVVIYSCGGGGFRRDNSILAAELASYGFIVLSADHEDCPYTQLPDGSPAQGTLAMDSPLTYEFRYRDTRLILDHLAALNETDDMLRGRIDLNRIGMCGWSIGGVCAAQACLEDSRVKAGVLLDPGLISMVEDLLGVGIAKPLLVITGEFVDGFELFNLATGPAYWLHIEGSVHRNMSVMPLFDGGNSARRLSQVLLAYAISTFNKFLQGENDLLLEGPSPFYPEVTEILSR